MLKTNIPATENTAEISLTIDVLPVPAGPAHRKFMNLRRTKDGLIRNPYTISDTASKIMGCWL